MQMKGNEIFLLFIFLNICFGCPTSLEGLTGKIVTPENGNFSLDIVDANQGVYNGVPCVVVFCFDADDVINAVNFAAINNIIPSVRSGRHSYMAYSVLNASILIDVSQMNSIELLEGTTVKFEAGVRMIEAYNFVIKHNLILPGGTCPSVGISGFVLGGGYGFFARKYGLAIDSLVSLDIVLPTGQLITANATHYSDLFWACRGGGNGNFGVIVSLTLTLPQIPASQPLSKFVINWNGDAQAQIIDGWQNFLSTIPDELTLNLMVYHTSISSTGIFFGTAANLTQIIKPLMLLGTIRSYNVSAMSLPQIILALAGCKNFSQCLAEGRDEPTPTNHGFRGKSCYANSTLSSEGINTLLSYEQGDSYHSNFTALTLCMFDSYGGKINTLPSDFAAFPHRNMLFHIQTLIYWDSTSQDGGEADFWVKNFYSEMQTYMTPFAYVNYIDGDLPNWQYAYWADNFGKLKSVKSIYDPTNMFTYAQSIIPTV